MLIPTTYGRLGNQLYLALQAYIKHTTFKPTRNVEDMIYFTSKDFCSDDNNGVIHENRYCQGFGFDYTAEEMNGFIKDVIMESAAIKEYKHTYDVENTTVIHIRGTDFLSSPNINWFDTSDYLEQACAKHQTENALVITDDTSYVKNKFNDILSKKYSNVTIRCNTPSQDLQDMSFAKYKILWNSTFSFWSGYISHFIYRNGKCIVSPNTMYINTPQKDNPVNPSWNIIQCKKNK